MVTKANLALALLLFWCAGANAALIPTDLDVVVSVNFDDSPGGEIVGNGTQIASAGVIVGGVFDGFSVDGTQSTPSSGVSSVLTDLNDGFSIDSRTQVSNDSQVDESILPGFGFDAFFDIKNTSLIDTYLLTFNIAYSVALEAGGDDAYSDIEMDFINDLTDLWFLDISSDTTFGNYRNDQDFFDFGGPMNERGGVSINVLITPGQSLFLESQITTSLGAYVDGDFAAGTAILSIGLNSAEKLQDPSPVNAPNTFIVLCIGLLTVLFKMQLKRKR